MCRICLDWQLGKLTKKEALRNLTEIVFVGGNTDEELTHFFEVAEKINKENESKD